MLRRTAAPLLCVLGIAVLVTGCPPKKLELCDQRVKNACYGCNPYLEQYRVFYQSLDQTLLTEVKRCLDASTDASVKSVEYVKGTFKGCISTNKKIDEKTRDKLLAQIDRVPVAEKEYVVWLGCYERLPGIRNKPVVVLMDSHLKDVVYCEHTREIGASNADDIINLIKDLPVGIATASTNLEWKNDQQVIDMNPALVVVHASAFYKETQPMDANQRLLTFLDEMKTTPTKILVYTRGLPDEAGPDVKLRWDRLLGKLNEPELKKKAQLFVMPKGHASCFDDPDVARPLKNKIKEMLALK